MNERVKTLSLEARKLSPDERFDLVDDILNSIGEPAGEHDAAWVAEIETRIAAEERGEARLIPADEVFAKHRRP